MSEPTETNVDRLQRRAESALERRRLTEAETLLDRLVEAAEPGSLSALFAHRHLAELRLERHPWRAALHLKHLADADPDDDVPHAMMGLCQALLGNYRASIAAYRRALRCAPRTPWYLHNLGHLLDVALDEPAAALEPLRTAWKLEPDHDEIVASLAHCLARLEQLEEALELARHATELAPKNPDHKRLVGWIERGAPPKEDVGSGSRGTAPEPEVEENAGPAAGSRRVDAKTRAVRETFERQMRAAGFSTEQVARARALWRDFRTARSVRVGKPEVYAAAIEYAIAMVVRRRGSSQAKIAQRYGVATTSLSGRFQEIQHALGLVPGDPRYTAG
ncbi:MAG: tetratricopeptide repeat protein [Sandaracinus sp.]|nr:tetratricopeptide repeat protein [Sandaracinus sp.]MCB9615372.1 tetratricopeptide repeat protein [Sandaracinus sp.]MCB9634958.1 tetratricopeptide repeat protein [Sandaracinus sp.]